MGILIGAYVVLLTMMLSVCRVRGVLLKTLNFFTQVQPSLTRHTLIQLLFRVTGIFIVSAMLTYGHIIGQTQLSTQEQLQKYVTERGKREEEIFQLAIDRHIMFKQAFATVAAQTSACGTPDTSIYSWSDGTHRNITEQQDVHQFEGASKSSVFVGRKCSPDGGAYLSRFGRFETLLLQYAPAWRDRFVNTWIASPDNIAVTYWPELPGPLMVFRGFWMSCTEKFFYVF